MSEPLPHTRFHGLEIELRSIPGARAVRVIHPPGQSIEAHRHDWPCLTLPALGGCLEVFDDGEVLLDSPAALFHPAGVTHADHVSSAGMETVSLQFDPGWLRSAGYDGCMQRSRCWTGGGVAQAVGKLASAWATPDTTESTLATATAVFLDSVVGAGRSARPAWLDHVLEALDTEPWCGTRRLSVELDLHPAWLARAYRNAAGEGLLDSLRRRRAGRAVALLRGSEGSLADTAIAAGFCDQSHMTRAFRTLIGRTPLQVRAERRSLTELTSSRRL